jgi:acetoin utilization deacetylase AcuC-like enzyme
VKLFYHPDLWAPRYAVETTRKPRWMIESLQEDPLQDLALTLCQPATRDDLLALHDEVYLNAIQTGKPLPLAQSQGFDWDEHIFPMALAACGAMRDAALAALEHSVSGSLGGGFHHAKRHRGQGCCTLQGVILAARAALQQGCGHVLIIDLDAHCAGGTHSYLQPEDPIWQLDLATSPVDGYRAVPPQTLDLLRDAARYLPTLQSRLASLQKIGPRFGLCIYKAGMDLYEGCDTGGLVGISQEIIAQREKMVFSWCRSRQIPIAFTLAGGYTGPNLSQQELVSLHRITLQQALGLCDKEPPTVEIKAP